MKRTLLAMGVIGLSLVAGAARADVVGPDPTACPEGASPTSCHGGPFCKPLTCVENADCSGGTICKEQPLCITSISCGGQIPPDADPHMFDQLNANGVCSQGEACTGGAICTTLKVCLLPWEGTSSGASSGGTPEDSGGCSCRVPGIGREGTGTALAALAAVAAGIALLSRRAPRR